MHPIILGQLARHHVDSLVREADADRLVRLVTAARRPQGLRRRAGLGLIALGNRLACDGTAGLAGVPGGRA